MVATRRIPAGHARRILGRWVGVFALLASMGTTPPLSAQDAPAFEIRTFNESVFVEWTFPSPGWYLEFTTSDLGETDWNGVAPNFIGVDNTENPELWFIFAANPNRYFFRLYDHFARIAANPAMMTTSSGLRYEILRPGSGIAPDANDEVTVDYEGSFPTGQVFDSSYTRGTPSTFSVDGVIPGFAEGLQLLKEGGEIRLHLPYDLAYGQFGTSTIPPYATLVFRVELISVSPVAGE